MKYITAFIIKLVMTTIVLWLVLTLISEVSLGSIILTSIILTIVGFIGDVFIFPRIGNVLTSILDFILIFVVLWLPGRVLFNSGQEAEAAALISATILTIGEMFLHRMMERQVLKDNISRMPSYQQNNLRMESSDEIDPKHKG
ncbi:DUF2512 family protein [Oceanobacillus piezotolerans]|uniref:DUF2512 family protein n=1 Tax=Oceanobacillus piezotolerans TaxID=2448030 RepID=A0A498DL06_9BACI|nr:DUF2512 family protein [Oceanobacillus piezotolerans]RLL47720.1 DUF2512 family protein [Oceanobacillus piezotolerans]